MDWDLRFKIYKHLLRPTKCKALYSACGGYGTNKAWRLLLRNDYPSSSLSLATSLSHALSSHPSSLMWNPYSIPALLPSPHLCSCLVTKKSKLSGMNYFYFPFHRTTTWPGSCNPSSPFLEINEGCAPAKWENTKKRRHGIWKIEGLPKNSSKE